MRAATLAVAISAFAALVPAQTVYTADDLDDVDNISSTTRSSWCRGQRNSCSSLCDSATTNDCDTDTLEFDCECNNGSAPGLQYYQATMPTYICNYVFQQCIDGAPNDADAQQECIDNRDAGCSNLQDVPDNADSETTTTTSTTSADDSESTDEATTTTTADGSDSTGDSDSDSSDDADSSEDDDSPAASNAAPLVGAAAVAVAMLTYLF